MIELRMPKIDAPSDREQLAQIKSYLYQLIPQLQMHLEKLKGADSSARVSASAQGDVVKISVSSARDSYTIEASPGGIIYTKNGSVLWKK